MKKVALTLVVVVVTAISSFGQYESNWALGLRVGEPLGLNIRKYFSYGDRAFDVNIGTFGLLYGRERYYNKKKIYASAGVMFQAIYSWHFSAFNSDNFHVYYGLGGQINSRDRVLDTGIREDKFRVISVGPAGAAGMEFTLPDKNLGIFLDAGGYLEIAPKPFFPNAQISAGLRVNLVK
jgi:hypothetical protein